MIVKIIVGIQSLILRSESNLAQQHNAGVVVLAREAIVGAFADLNTTMIRKSSKAAFGSVDENSNDAIVTWRTMSAKYTPLPNLHKSEKTRACH